ncbi:MAG: hypothetical protein LBD52_02530, partial [Prevotellaceae bacterium]|nr:hypothetical protein [Prevotellaceae bacterium]
MTATTAQNVSTTDTTIRQATKVFSRFQIGGYGEAVMQRMFYSDSPARYAYPASHAGKTHGRVDLPHV